MIIINELKLIIYYKGFMTSVLQMHARKHIIPIDGLSFDFSVTSFKEIDEIKNKPNDGIYINGLYLDGAKWNTKDNYLDDADPGI